MEKLRRKEGRQVTHRQALDGFLDHQWWGVLCVGNVTRGDGTVRPLVVPTLFARHDDRILIHGSTGAGAIGVNSNAGSVAFCVTAMDALVVAHSTFDSSVHYRSAVVYGPLEVARHEDRTWLLDRFSELLIPGRTTEVRQSTPKEVAATNVVALPITDGNWVYKVNDGPVDEPLEETSAWAGVVPFTFGYDAPQRAAWSTAPLPNSVSRMVGST